MILLLSLFIRSLYHGISRTDPFEFELSSPTPTYPSSSAYRYIWSTGLLGPMIAVRRSVRTSMFFILVYPFFVSDSGLFRYSRKCSFTRLEYATFCITVFMLFMSSSVKAAVVTTSFPIASKALLFIFRDSDTAK